MKTYVAYKTWKFEIVSGKATVNEVTDFLISMLDWMREQQEDYYSLYSEKLFEVLSDVGKFSFNSLGRKYGIEPITAAHNNAFNYAEMFRANLLSSCAGIVQRNEIVKLIKPDSTAESLQRDFVTTYPKTKAPSLRYLQSIINNPNMGSYAPNVSLPLWATDGHFCAIKRQKREVFLTIRLPYGSTTLKFCLPKGERFEGKICRPTVLISNGKLQFNFAIEKDIVPLKDNKTVLGVDLGKVENFVATAVSPESYSAPLYPNKQIRRLDSAISNLTKHISELYSKEKLCEQKGHTTKSEILHIERIRVRSKRSRLKAQRRVRTASLILSYAQKMGANIVAVEDLRWLKSKGRTWDHALTQTTIVQQAARKGVRVKRVSAQHTSTMCPMCGKSTQAKGRYRLCENCKTRLNRDVLASRNIALRALKLKTTKDLIYLNSVETQLPKPALTTGEVTVESSSSKIYR